jgi:hypothetical protein
MDAVDARWALQTIQSAALPLGAPNRGGRSDMPINLADLRAACVDYLQASVVCKLENLVADVPNAISPGEGFKFDLRATNTGAIRVAKVKYHVYVADPSKAKVVVPFYFMPGIRIARSGATEDSPTLAPGSQVAEMYLFPLDTDRKVLDPNESDTWAGLRGIAHSLGNTSIRLNVLGQVDLDYVFPSNAPSKQAMLAIQVV